MAAAAMKPGLTVIKDNLGNLKKGLDHLSGTQVMVGVPGDKSERGEPINNAALAYIHDNGSMLAGIPARQFMIPGVVAVEPDNDASFRKAAAAALEGRVKDVDAGLNAVGLRTQASMRNVIRSRIPPPLAASTLAARRRRGRTGDVPLIDTGKMLAALNYVIRKMKRA
jgi:hypothetical protein